MTWGEMKFQVGDNVLLFDENIRHGRYRNMNGQLIGTYNKK